MRTDSRPNRIERFVNCGSQAWLDRSADGQEIRLRSSNCHDRFCEPCARDRGAKIFESISRATKGTDRPFYFVTLTLKHRDVPLTAQLDRLYRCFSALRHRDIWSRNIEGGAAFLELKLGQDDLWGPHLHILCHGRYTSQKELSAAWYQITGDSFRVDIRRPPSTDDVKRYVTSYVTKAATTDVYSQPDRLDEMIVALRGRRLCLTFGTWRGLKLTEVVDDGREWVSLGSPDQLRARALRGDHDAQRWIYAACRKYNGLAEALGIDLTHFPTGPPPDSVAEFT